MLKTRSSRSSLSKPFKSPKRVAPALAAETADSAVTNDDSKKPPAATSHTPTPISRKRRIPSSAPPLRSMLGSNMPATPTPASKRKRLRTPCSSIAGSLGKPLGSVPRLALRDEATQALFQEKNSLQRELNDLKEEVALLERAKALEEKDDAKVVDSLISKWQIACSAACDELFELLKPMMEAQRQASLQGFGSGFDQGESEDTNCFGFGRQKLQQQQQQQQQQQKDENEEQEADQCEEIDIPYMLKRFGIDPELF